MTSFAQNGLLLDVQHVTMRFGGITAVNDLSMRIPTGSITGLIGPNGAGKTTAFNVISGFYNPQEGDILFKGHSVKGFPPHRICRAGMARTFQNIRLFGSETALENVMVGCQVRRKSQWWMPVFSLPSARREEEEIREKAKGLIHRLALDSYMDEKASSLPYGAQGRLEIARALATSPDFLLLDEPAAGMNPQESTELMRFIRHIRDEFDLTILLIEHDMKVVMGVCQYIWVLEYGQLIAEGDPDAIRNNPRVIEASERTSATMLEIKDLHVHYGGIHAVQGVSMHIPQGRIVTLIGANGAGKSSVIRSISGLVKDTKGEVLFTPAARDGSGPRTEQLLGKSPEDIIRRGISVSPEGRRILPHLTVEENLMLGAYIRNDKEGIAQDIDWVYNLFPRLRERSWQKGGTLSGGEQQMLAVGRALMSRPDLVMLDEPSLGLAPLLVREIFDIILKINAEGKTVLLVEQNALAALSIAHYAYVLEVGRVVAEAPGQELLKDPKVKEAYLGG